MKLFAVPFARMKSGEKNIEFRLYDEKRQKVESGDYITFKNVDTGEELIAKCIDLYRADTFQELFENLYVESKTNRKGNISPREMSEKMREYYSEENERKYGVLGIKIKVLQDETDSH